MKRPTLQRLADSTPLTRRAHQRLQRSRAIALVRESGVFHQEWYETQKGRSFGSVDDAIADYLTRGRRRGLSPHPLVWPASIAPKAWSTAPADPLLRLLKRGAAVPRQVLFDAERYLESTPAARTHEHGPLSYFLSTATASTPMPARRGLSLTWGEVERASLEAAEQIAADRRRDRTAVLPRWDHAAEARFLAGLGTAVSSEVVSVVLPVFNRPEQLARAVDSVRRQTHTAWELIVVDDGSTDSTPEVARALAEAEPRVRVLVGEHGGVSAARNLGLAAATGSHIAFLDSDNEWEPDHLRVMLAAMGRAGWRLAHSGVTGFKDGEIWFRGSDGGLDELLVNNFIDLNAVVVDRALLDEVGGFDTQLRRMVDWDLLIRLARVERPHLVPVLGVRYDDSRAGHARITTHESRSWREVILSNHVIDWAGLETAERVTGLVSVVIPTFRDWEMTVHAVESVLATTRPGEVEVVVVDNGSPTIVWQMLSVLLGHHDSVELVREPHNNHFALGSDLGFARGRGELTLFLNNDTVVRPGWLPPLRAALDSPDVMGVQPLLVYPDGTVQCAGVVFPPFAGLPVHLLADHPAEDARRAGQIAVHAITGAALLMRSVDVARLRGFDPIFSNGWEDVDLCLRAGGDTARVFRVVTSSEVLHLEGRTPGRGHRLAANRDVFLARWKDRLPREDGSLWRQAGFEVAHYEAEQVDGEVARPRVSRPVTVRRDPRLRWAIKIAAYAGPRGDVWGDVHFAAALARALRKLDQDVVVDRVEAHERSTSYLDDVTLTLRGITETAVQPGRTSLLWVISHPELVTVDEIRRHDAVFAASVPWAATMSGQAGVPVRPLLQATDPILFHPGRGTPGTGPGALFVGSSRHVFRPVVRDALEACDDLVVHGTTWGEFPAVAAIAQPPVPNTELGALYRSAGVVLNDHWAEMAAEGFVSNRLFDAVASGARVVSDEVVGLQELFGGAVQVYSTVEDLRRLTGPRRDEFFPSDSERVRIAAAVAAEHSFDHRAEQLLEAVRELRA